MTKLDMLFHIADLMSDNSEYDRACVEIALSLFGNPEYDREDMFSLLQFVRTGELHQTI